LRCAAAFLCAVAGAALGQPAGEQPPAPSLQPAGADRVPPELEPFEGRPVRSVVFIVPASKAGQQSASLPEADESLARNQLRQREGTPFSARLVSEDISRLNRVGRFRSVESRVVQLADGSVELAYLVSLQPLIGAVQTVGNKAFSDEQLAEDIDMLVGTPVQPAALDRACRRIEDRYRQKGYANAICTVDEGELEANGIVLFKVREGERTKVTLIRFEGVKSYLPSQVKSVLKTKEAWLLERGEVDQDKLDDDVASVIEFYRDRGFLDIRADRIVTPSPDGREAIVTFVVDEGPVYTLRDLILKVAEGQDSVMDERQLQAFLTIRPGDVYSERKLKESIKAVQDAYGAMGYVDAKVSRRDLRDPDHPLVDIRLEVAPGRTFKAGMVEVQGNTGTRDKVVRRLVTVRPDDPLDTTELERTKTRLSQTRLFAPRSVKTVIQPEREDEPGYRDVLVEVEETNTGSFTFGAGFSADSGATAQIAFQQRNFDISDTPDSWGELFTGESFHGAGQTLGLQILPGTRSRALQLSLAEPYLFGTDYSGSTSIYYRRRLFSAYDETRYGARAALGRRFGSLWSINLPVKIESVKLSNIDADAPTEYFDLADSRALASFGISLTRSTYDNPAFPTRGTRAELSIEQVAGDFTFTKLGGEFSRYFKLDEGVLGERTTLRLSTSANYILQDQEEVPFYERYYLGGDNFRGFDFRGISPVGIRNDTGGISSEPVGGIFSFFAGAELRRSLYEDLLSGVVFIDSGVVTDELSFSPYRISTGVGLRIYVEQLSPIPLAFDFGIPLKKEDTDDTRFFNFSFELPFN